MNYQKIYENLIERSRNRNLNEYTEQHHIVPKCIGGSDDPDNLVRLTPEEHYVAHQLLTRIYPDEPKLIYAAALMGLTRPSNKIYGWLKRRKAKAFSDYMSGSNWITNGIENRIIKNQSIPDGWYPGITMNPDIVLKRKQKWDEHHRSFIEYWFNEWSKEPFSSMNEFIQKSNYPHTYGHFKKLVYRFIEKERLENVKTAKKVNREKRNKEDAYRLYNDFIKSGLSIEEFVKNSNYPHSLSHLKNTLSNYVDEYNPIEITKTKALEDAIYWKDQFERSGYKIRKEFVENSNYPYSYSNFNKQMQLIKKGSPKAPSSDG